MGLDSKDAKYKYVNLACLSNIDDKFKTVNAFAYSKLPAIFHD